MEKLFTDDWTMDPSEFNYQIAFRPSQYCAGNLAESWEFTSPATLTVQLRQGVHWQDIAPVNGREFTSADVVYHFNRMYGLAGMPKSTKVFNAVFNNLQSVTAPSKYTVVIQFAPGTNPEIIIELLEAQSALDTFIEAQEVVAAGEINDWHHAIGTGPFMLQGFVSGSSAILVRNPNYWGIDERYPQNKLPYIDALRFLIIPDSSTALAAFRTGKISILDNNTLQTAQTMKKANPEVQQIGIPAADANTIDPRNDLAPFSDIRVRKALQMAIDLQNIAATFYGGTISPNPCSLTSNLMTGWGYPYEAWPQDLKDEYAYNVPGAKALLAAAGYSTGFDTNIVVQAGADLELLQVVQFYFTAIGVKMEIRPMDSPSWSALVRSNRKQDALAMKSLGILGLGFEPTSHLIWFTWGPADYTMVNDPTFNAFQVALNASTSTDQIKQIIHDANKYAAEQHFSICLLQPNTFSFIQPYIKGYNGQNQATTVTTGGAMQNGFYFARFWIDQSLMK
jgi:peptide/nickel transport system substrate-binding protein